ncbi:tetratricopeptide repeat protein, partial [Actinoplanes utahensis]
TAALDARRMGVRAPLTREFLAAAAPGYLTSAQQAAAPPDWLDQAVSYATAKLHGAASCLTPVAGGMGVVRGYHTADYLHQHALVARRTAPLPDAVWTALVDHHDPEDTNRLADSADRRAQHRHATALYRRLADRDAPGAALTLATHLQLRGNVTELRERADAGDVAASSRLAELLRDRGGRDELRQRADAGDQYAGRALAELLTSEEKLDEAAALLRRLAESGDPQTNRRLAGVLACQGHIDEAIGHLRARAEEKDQTAARQLAVLLFRQGRGDEAVALLQQPAHAEDSLNKMQLARILVRLGRIGELQERAADGDPEAVALWAEDLIRKGQTVEATALVEQHVHLSSGRPRRGPLTALLAKLLAQQGRSDELRQRSAAGDRHAADALARLLAENGDAGGLRALADSGNSAASTRYADLLERTGRADEAIAMLRRRLDSGDRKPARRLIALLERQGCVDEALTILRRLSDSGDSRSSALLLNMLVKHARFDEIELEARAGTFAADVYWNFWKDHRKFGARMSEFQESWLQRFDRPTAGPSPARTAGQREVFSVNLIDGTIQQLI